ncbi:MAG: bifunctional pyr operon transcriptional regulator/uracil phosphoribosyltransferase PyrR [Phycisphaerae bacterium]|nr:bifunctional pyr operon transcriptional regulator/uracil phosphoribosyltransferase PyrR [Phycisphaerae bacterium]
MKVILKAEQVKGVLDELAESIVSAVGRDADFAFIGIRSRGEVIAQRLEEIVSKRLKRDIPCGTLDITLYRDDLSSRYNQPEVRTTEINFDISDKVIILVDDVLHTGRSTRAAIDALMDMGRPKAIRLAVLVERSGRELPIQAEYIGYRSDAVEKEHVQVHLSESDGTDEVTIE